MSKEDTTSKIKIKIERNRKEEKVEEVNEEVDIVEEMKSEEPEKGIKKKPGKNIISDSKELQKIEEVITMRKTVPKIEQEKIMKRINKNLLISLLFMGLVCIFHMGYINLESSMFVTDLKFFALISVLAAIILFEKAYKKNNGELCVFGIETLVFAILVLFLPYVYFYANITFGVLIAFSPLYIGIYYTAKCIIIERRETKKYLKSLSDVKEIIKKNKRKEL